MTRRDHDFLIRLKRTGNGLLTLRLPQIQECFYHVYPELRTHVTTRKQLATALGELVEARQITLPSSAKNYDRTALPPLPAFIRLLAQKGTTSTAPPIFDHRSFRWTLPMSFVASLPKPPGADILLALNEFFRVPDAATREFIPVKERSHGIFRDEKRLEKVLAGQLGSPGRLTLELLRCYKVPLVPVHLTFPAAKGDAIIIENEATFDSIARWNRIHFQFRFVVYGRGLEIMKATHFLLRQIAHPGIRYYYFGDVDPGGILIPWNLSRILQRETDARLLPAETCYRLLFRQGSSTPTPFDDAVKQTPTDAGINLDWRKALDWLPADLRSPVNVLLTRDQRIAQEAASWEILRNESSLI